MSENPGRVFWWWCTTTTNRSWYLFVQGHVTFIVIHLMDKFIRPSYKIKRLNEPRGATLPAHPGGPRLLVLFSVVWFFLFVRVVFWVRSAAVRLFVLIFVFRAEFYFTPLSENN